MSLFEAFYVISYTATTIGLGELPQPYSGAQRIWMVFSMYATVVAWSFSIFNVLALLQEPTFQNAVRSGRFTRRVKGIREPFYIICGVGETGLRVARGLDRLGFRIVVIDNDGDQLQSFRLEDLRQDAPAKLGDAADPSTLVEAGLLNPWCRGVLAMTASDETNRSISVAVRLLAPKVHILKRVRDEDDDAHYRSGAAYTINPFERFADHLVSAVAAPERYQLREILTGIPGDPIPEMHHPPRGRWIMCGYGRFGHAVVASLEEAGFEVCVVDQQHFGEAGVDVEGSGTRPETLKLAGIDESVGIVAGNSNDLKNLGVALNARNLNPSIFIVTRQNQNSNAALFEAFTGDLAMIPSQLVAREFLALLTTPMVSRMLEILPDHDEEWCAELNRRLTGAGGGLIPDIDSVGLTQEEGVAARDWLKAGHDMRLGNLLQGAGDARPFSLMVLLVLRAGEVIELPDDDLVLKRGDQLLLAGKTADIQRLKAVLRHSDLLTERLTGEDKPNGWLFRAIQRRTKQAA